MSIFGKNINLNTGHVCQIRKNPQISYDPRKLTVKKFQSIVYVKEYFYMFFSREKTLYKHKVKQILELDKIL